MPTSRAVLRLFALVLAAAPVLPAQSPALRIERAGRDAAPFTVDALRQLPGDTVSFSAHDAPPVVYRAVRLSDLLAAAGSPLDSLRVGRVAWVVAAMASDGYTIVFSAAELDPKLGPTRAWLAFERERGPLGADEGPFRLIVPTDAHAARSAHAVITLRVVDALAAGGAP